jgi:DNA-directed RNA polymerase specialized sigma24 family protein
MEDADVVAAFLGGEERAFREIVNRYQTRILNFVYRTISDREKAEDLVQDVFLRRTTDRCSCCATSRAGRTRRSPRSRVRRSGR